MFTYPVSFILPNCCLVINEPARGHTVNRNNDLLLEIHIVAATTLTPSTSFITTRAEVALLSSRREYSSCLLIPWLYQNSDTTRSGQYSRGFIVPGQLHYVYDSISGITEQERAIMMSMTVGKGM